MELVRVAGVVVSVHIVLADIKVVRTALVQVVLQGFMAHITGVTTELFVLVGTSLVMALMPVRVNNVNLVTVIVLEVVSRAVIQYVLLTLLVRVAKVVVILIMELVIRIAMVVILLATALVTADVMALIPVSLM